MLAKDLGTDFDLPLPSSKMEHVIELTELHELTVEVHGARTPFAGSLRCQQDRL